MSVFPSLSFTFYFNICHTHNRTLSALASTKQCPWTYIFLQNADKALYLLQRQPVEVLPGFRVPPAWALCANFPTVGFPLYFSSLTLRCGHTWSAQEWEVGTCRTPRDANTHVSMQQPVQPEPVPAQEGPPTGLFKRKERAVIYSEESERVAYRYWKGKLDCFFFLYAGHMSTVLARAGVVPFF